jgi:hypothetical protein
MRKGITRNIFNGRLQKRAEAGNEERKNYGTFIALFLPPLSRALLLFLIQNKN